jgi:hypothetical protein
VKKILFAFLFLPSLAFSSYQPITGSTVTITTENNNTTPIAVYSPAAIPIVSSNTINVAEQNTIKVGPGATNLVITSTSTIPVSGPIVVTPGATNIVVTATATINTSQQGNITINSIPAGTNNIGIVNGSTVTVNGVVHTAFPTAASDGQFVAKMEDKFGRDVTIADCPMDLQVSTTVTLSASTSETLLLSSGTAGVFNDLVSLIVSNSGSTASLLTFRNTGFATTGWLHVFVPATDTRGLTTSHVWPQQATASDWTVQGSASSSSIFVDAVFCQRK